MRRSLLAVMICLFALTGLARGQQEGMFSETVKDFGVVPRGPLMKHYFTVKNTTGQTMTIGNVRVSCGCTSASATVNTIAPGKTGAIYATMDTRRFLGDKTVTIYVQTVAPVFTEYALQVKAHSRSDFQMTPDALNFGRVDHGQGGSTKITVSFFGNPNWKITDSSCKSNYIEPDVKQVKSTPYETTYEISAKLRDDVPVGNWFSEIELTTNLRGAEKLRVPASVQVVSAVSAQPAQLNWQSVKVGEEAEERVVLKGTKPFKVLRVEGAQGRLSVDGIGEEAKAAHVLTFRYTPEKAGVFKGTLKIVTDMDDSPALSLPAMVIAK